MRQRPAPTVWNNRSVNKEERRRRWTTPFGETIDHTRIEIALDYEAASRLNYISHTKNWSDRQFKLRTYCAGHPLRITELVRREHREPKRLGVVSRPE